MRTSKFNNYLENFRSNVISSIIGQVRIPNEGESSINSEHFDNYLSKLQNICTDNIGGVATNVSADSSMDGHHQKSAPMYDSVKNALVPGFNPLSTRI